MKLLVVLALLAAAAAEDKSPAEDSQAQASTATGDKLEKRGTAKQTGVPTSLSADPSQYSGYQAQQYLQQYLQPQAQPQPQPQVQQQYLQLQPQAQQYLQQAYSAAQPQQDLSYLAHARYQQPQYFLPPPQQQQLQYYLPQQQQQQLQYFLPPQQQQYYVMMLVPGPALGYLPEQQVPRPLYQPSSPPQQQLSYLSQQHAAKGQAQSSHVKG
ncbi:uncharacterized protein LOC134530648 [Bacillus rossius redtenbacheri]|uniref:uncharacterized protein LOC134530648 n=1 Tax=Bacillus rossius redtenbacheri TaxID=93214 RepID=UPI002FDD23E4